MSTHGFILLTHSGQTQLIILAIYNWIKHFNNHGQQDSIQQFIQLTKSLENTSITVILNSTLQYSIITQKNISFFYCTKAWQTLFMHRFFRDGLRQALQFLQGFIRQLLHFPQFDRLFRLKVVNVVGVAEVAIRAVVIGLGSREV